MIDALVHYFLLICYYLLLIYYLLIVIYFIMGWLPFLRDKKIYLFFEKIASPFNKLFRGKLVSGGLDLGSTIGLIIFAVLLRFLGNIL